MLSNIISLKTGSDLLLTKKLIFISQVTRLMPALKLMWPFITGSHYIKFIPHTSILKAYIIISGQLYVWGLNISFPENMFRYLNTFVLNFTTIE